MRRFRGDAEELTRGLGRNAATAQIAGIVVTQKKRAATEWRRAVCLVL
jgi:hypothetical protein